jgi:hypothetical protein
MSNKAEFKHVFLLGLFAVFGLLIGGWSRFATNEEIHMRKIREWIVRLPACSNKQPQGPRNSMRRFESHLHLHIEDSLRSVCRLKRRDARRCSSWEELSPMKEAYRDQRGPAFAGNALAGTSVSERGCLSPKEPRLSTAVATLLLTSRAGGHRCEHGLFSAAVYAVLDSSTAVFLTAGRSRHDLG